MFAGKWVWIEEEPPRRVQKGKSKGKAGSKGIRKGKGALLEHWLNERTHHNMQKQSKTLN